MSGREPPVADRSGPDPRADPHPDPDRPGGADAAAAGVSWVEAPGTDPSAPALADAGDPARPVWTYGELAGQALARAGRLRRAGVAPGQLVAVPERPGAELVLMQHALARVGAALLAVRQPSDCAPVRALLAHTGAEWLWDGAGEGGPIALARGRAAVERPAGAGDRWDSPLALTVETSGSTGAPRAAMLTVGNLRTSARLTNVRLGLGGADAWLCCLPLRHIGGLSIGYRCALAGARMVLRQPFDARAVRDDLERHAITHVSLVPPMLARLLDLAPERPPPAGLRVVLVGGQSLSQPLARRAIDLGWPIRVTYGTTETASQIAVSERLSAPPTGGRIGFALPRLTLDCPPWDAPPAPLRLRGPLVMAGYANPGRVPGMGLADGWLATGDLACRGPDGALCILGRADEVLVTGGVNVHPARVEAALLAAPGVRDLAVVGVPDPVWGQRLVAVYRGDATPAELDAWCRAGPLPGAERPRTFLRVAELPVLESGKRDRRRLRELAGDRAAAPDRRPPDADTRG